MQPAKELAALLGTKREPICATWIDLIEQMPDMQAMGQSALDLHMLTTHGLDVLVACLSTGSYATLESYLTSVYEAYLSCLLYTSPSPRDRTRSRMPSSA